MRCLVQNRKLDRQPTDNDCATGADFTFTALRVFRSGTDLVSLLIVLLLQQLKHFYFVNIDISPSTTLAH